MPAMTRPSLYAFAAGEPAFLALARAHHARCLADPELNHPFSHPGGHPQHVERLAAYWAEVLGGPPAYTTACGGDQSRAGYAPYGTEVAPGAPMPRWGWAGREA